MGGRGRTDVRSFFLIAAAKERVSAARVVTCSIYYYAYASPDDDEASTTLDNDEGYDAKCVRLRSTYIVCLLLSRRRILFFLLNIFDKMGRTST